MPAATAAAAPLPAAPAAAAAAAAAFPDPSPEPLFDACRAKTDAGRGGGLVPPANARCGHGARWALCEGLSK